MSGKTGQKPKHVKPLRDLGALVGLSPDTVRGNFERGAPTPKHLRDIQPWVKRFHTWRKANVGTFQDEQRRVAAAARDPARDKHEREYARLRTEKARLDVGERMRTLVQRADVVQLAGKSVLTVRLRLNALVQKMTARLANVPDHVVAEELQDEVDEICNAFAQGMTKTFGGLDDALPCPFCNQEKA